MKWIASTAIVLLQITSRQRYVSAFIAAGIRSISNNRRYYPVTTIKIKVYAKKKSNMMSSTTISQHSSSSSPEAAAVPNDAPSDMSPCCQYVVSRNGIVLPWQQIHQQYRGVDVVDDDDNYDRSNQVVNDNNNNNIDNDSKPLDSNKILQLLPRGAYTTCRTVKGGSHIYQFDYHVRRLANSAKSILLEMQSASSSSSSSVGGSGREVQDDSNEDKDSEATLLATSNHPIQHDRTLSTFEINQLHIINVAWEHNMALKCIRNTLREFCICYGLRLQNEEGGCDDADEKAEFKITLLATWEKNDPPNDIKSHTTYESVLYCHVGLLNQKKVSTTTASLTKKPPHIRVLIHGHGRENALAKDSKWVLDREKLIKPSTTEDDRREDDEGGTHKEVSQQPFEEIILINDNGELLEGTQTNFYVVSGGQNQQQPSSIITANEGILYGSVRDSVLRACRHHNIPVKLRPPTLQDLKDASGVFISSTSRWVMPVHEVCLGDLMSFQNADDGDVEKEERSESIKKKKRDGKSYFYRNCETTEDIRRWVLEDVESRSTPI
eukprot:scaffold14274_cov215-Skeletonema_marinoi.AAC.26